MATRRNDRIRTEAGHAVRNRQTWDVEEVGADGSLLLVDPTRGRVRLPEAYVARHVELGWAVTGYGNQGDTTDHGICVVEPSSTRAGAYVGMTRGRGRNIALVVDPTGLEDAEEAFAAVIARPANARTALAVRARLAGEQGATVPVTGPEAPATIVPGAVAGSRTARPAEPCPVGPDAVTQSNTPSTEPTPDATPARATPAGEAEPDGAAATASTPASAPTPAAPSEEPAVIDEDDDLAARMARRLRHVETRRPGRARRR